MCLETALHLLASIILVVISKKASVHSFFHSHIKGRVKEQNDEQEICLFTLFLA